MATFTPPIRYFVPSVTDATPERDKGFMKYVKNKIGVGVNVFIHNDNSVDESQGLWSNVKFCFYGGHSYQLTGEQITLLTNAGYGANITYP